MTRKWKEAEIRAELEPLMEQLRTAAPEERLKAAVEVEKQMEAQAQRYLDLLLPAFTEEADRDAATEIIQLMHLFAALADRFSALVGENDVELVYRDCIATRVFRETADLWQNRILAEYEKEEYPLNEDWLSFVDRSSTCIALIEQGISLTNDAILQGNVDRYEMLVRIHRICIDSCGWAFDMHGSNVNVSNTMGRSWHKDKHLSEKERKERIKRVFRYEKHISECRSALADMEIREQQRQQEAYWQEHPEALEAHRREQTLRKEQTAQLEKEAEDHLEKEENLQAALCFWRAGMFEKSREVLDFRKLIGAGQSHTVGLMPDGTVVAAGDGLDGKGNDMKVCHVSGWKNIVAIDAANFSTIGLRANGMLTACGTNVEGQLNVNLWREMIGFCAGNRHTLAIRKDGVVLSNGNNKYGQCKLQKLRNVAEVSAGVHHSLALLKDGTVKAFGAPDEGRCNTQNWKDIVMIAAGGGHSVGLKSDGTVVACGQNDEGQCNVEGWRNIVSIAAGTLHTVGIREDGTVVACGANDRGQCEVSEWTDIIALACSNHTVGLRSDGTVVCAGDNAHGQNKTGKWNLFSEQLQQRKKKLDQDVQPLMEELEAVKNELRSTNIFQRKKRKQLWERIQELEKRME